MRSAGAGSGGAWFPSASKPCAGHSPRASPRVSRNRGPRSLIAGDRGGITGEDWLWLFLLAMVSLTAGMGGMAWAQRHVSVAVSSVLALGATVITAVGAWVFFDQPLQVLQIVGGLVVLVSLGGIVVAQLAPPKVSGDQQLEPDLAGEQSGE